MKIKWGKSNKTKLGTFVKRHLRYSAGLQAFECSLSFQYHRYKVRRYYTQVWKLKIKAMLTE